MKKSPLEKNLLSELGVLGDPEQYKSMLDLFDLSNS